MYIASFQNRYQSLVTGLDSKCCPTDQLTVQKKAGFCKKVIQLFIRILSFGMIDPDRHVRVGRVASAIFEDCKKNIAELQDPNNVLLVLLVLEKLKQKNPKKFESVCELYRYAVIGMGTPMAPERYEKTKSSVWPESGREELTIDGKKDTEQPLLTKKETKSKQSKPATRGPATSGKAPPPPPPPPMSKASLKLVISKSPSKQVAGEGQTTSTVDQTPPKTAPRAQHKSLAEEAAAGRAKLLPGRARTGRANLEKRNTDPDLNKTTSNPLTSPMSSSTPALNPVKGLKRTSTQPNLSQSTDTATSPNLAAALAGLRKGKK